MATYRALGRTLLLPIPQLDSGQQGLELGWVTVVPGGTDGHGHSLGEDKQDSVKWIFIATRGNL